MAIRPRGPHQMVDSVGGDANLSIATDYIIEIAHLHFASEWRYFYRVFIRFLGRCVCAAGWPVGGRGSGASLFSSRW